jgi:hypothetical protein
MRAFQVATGRRGQRTEHTSAELPRRLLHQHVLDGVAERAQHQHGPQGRALHLLDPLVGQAQTVWAATERRTQNTAGTRGGTRQGGKLENYHNGRHRLND